MQQMLSEMRKARAAHIRWRSYAYAMVAGLEIEKEYLPLEHTGCAFGKWYHGVGKETFGHLDTYAGIEVPHRVLHKIYHKIFDLAKAGRLEDAGREAKNLTELSRQVLEALDLVEQEVTRIPVAAAESRNVELLRRRAG
jgi:hypothetical protein